MGVGKVAAAAAADLCTSGKRCICIVVASLRALSPRRLDAAGGRLIFFSGFESLFEKRARFSSCRARPFAFSLDTPSAVPMVSTLFNCRYGAHTLIIVTNIDEIPADSPRDNAREKLLNDARFGCVRALRGRGARARVISSDRASMCE